jgi:conjugative relaxase-like TrwC/TraI family protein
MVRITQSVSARAAEGYFREGLGAGEYYAQEDKTVGVWGGLGAQELSLAGEVSKECFRNLARGLHPASGEQLTARLEEDRRPGYDFTFSVPKSASVLAAVGTETDRTTVRTIFDRAVDQTMREIESDMQARVREKGADHDRVTGNMVWARFDHHVTRPVDGLPDPHLHAHVYVFNLTRDGDKWKAGQFGNLKADGPYWEAIFENRVATELQKAGYGIRRTAKGWEVSGIGDEIVEMFSCRTAEIEETIRKEASKLETRALSVMLETGKAYAQAYEQAKSEVGALTRDDKDKGIPYQEALQRWKERLGPDRLKTVRSARGQADEQVRTFN